jgi:membrane protease YdiL (CAAX protease family)
MRIRRNPYVMVLLLLPLSFVPRISSGSIVTWSLILISFYMIIPLIISAGLRFSHKELGIRIPSRHGWWLTGIFLFLAVLLAVGGTLIPSMVSYYPRFYMNSWLDFIKGELIMGVIMLTHETFFRGFLLFPLAGKDKKLAILIQDIPYTLVHIGKPAVEVPYSFFAGLVFGWLDVESDSFLPSFLVHWVGSAFFDLLCVLAKEGLLPWLS